MAIGFIGTGNIGNPMARRLLVAGHQLVVHDLREHTTANLIELGAVWASSPREVAQRCGVIFTSLPGPPEVERVVLGPDGIVEGAQPGTVLFDLTSSLPAAVRALATRAEERGVTLLDSPVSGGAHGAEAGTLAVMVGGDRAAFEAHRHLLEAFGANVFHLGPLGAGATVKLMNNLISLGVGPLLDEALAVGVKAGIPAETLHTVWSVSSASQYVRSLPHLFERGFDRPTFALALGAKDVGLAVTAGRELGVPMPVAASIEQVYLWAKAAGLGDKSPQATLLLYEQAAGVEVKAAEQQAAP